MADLRSAGRTLRQRLCVALVIAAAGLSLSAQDMARIEPARRIRVTNGSCITMVADPVSGYDLTNSCPACRTGLVSWCDGEGHAFNVRANSTVRIPACPGIQTLVSDIPCEHGH